MASSPSNEGRPRGWSEWRAWADELIETHRADQVADTIADLAEQVDALREGYASEARIVLAQTLDVKALGKARRGILTEQVKRMAAVALGGRPRGCVRGQQTLEEYVDRFITEDMPLTNVPVPKGSNVRHHYDEQGQEVFPCWCGETHTGDYALYEFGHHNCLHEAPLVWLYRGDGQAMCRACGRAFFIDDPDDVDAPSTQQKTED